MIKRTTLLLLAAALLLAWSGATAQAAYHHEGEIDSPHFLAAHPEKAGTKLDSCALCHTGGTYEKFPDSGKFVTVGSCQWCHRVFGYDKSGDILETLNPYGADYLEQGRSTQAVNLIAGWDSDEDGYSNQIEIEDDTYPGNPDDNPSKVPAPARVFTLSELENLTNHKQVQVMNTHKSGDFYCEYTGAVISEILEQAGMLDSAEGITVFSPDGWSQYHPLDWNLAEPNTLYPVIGAYPQPTFFYNEQADQAISDVGWCSYTSPSIQGYENGDLLGAEDGYKLILAYKRDGEYLDPGVLNLDNKLDGEGPFRVVPPQVEINPPDQASTSEFQDVIWPFTEDWDHNAGFSTRTVTIIRVEPLPEGTTDVDLLEAGWNYVDENKVLVYGAIDRSCATLAGPKGDMTITPDLGEVTYAQTTPVAKEGRPQGKKFPYGAFKFQITGLTPGGSVLVTFSMPRALDEDAGFYKIDAQGEWHEVPIIVSEDRMSFTVELVDGDPILDADQTVNGMITDPATISEPADTSSSSSGSSCVFNPQAGFSLEWLLLGIIPLARMIRRRRNR